MPNIHSCDKIVPPLLPYLFILKADCSKTFFIFGCWVKLFSRLFDFLLVNLISFLCHFYIILRTPKILNLPHLYISITCGHIFALNRLIKSVFNK